MTSPLSSLILPPSSLTLLERPAPMYPQFLALADTSIVNIDGKTKTFDDLIDEPNNRETVLRFTNKGVFASSQILDVEADLDSEGVQVVHIELHSGEKFTVLKSSQILSSENTWVSISSKKPGDGIKTLTYNPSVRHPQLTPKVISSVVEETLAFAPVVRFEITPSDNFLLAAAQDRDITVLVPVCPKQL